MRFSVILLSVLLSTGAAAQALHTFQNGEVADADQINENFQVLQEQLAGKSNIPQYQSNGWASTGWEAIYVDCDANAGALEESKDAIERGKNRVQVIIKGTCVLTDSFSISSQHVFLDGGGEGSTDLFTCTSSATIRGVGGPDPRASLSLYVRNGGTLLMRCLNLESDNTALLAAYTGSAIRTDGGVNATNGNLSVVLRNSLFRTFFNRHYESISLDSGAYAEINPNGISGSTPFSLGDVTVRARSSLTCRICGSEPPNGDYSSAWLGGTIDNLTLDTGSSLIIGLIVNGDVNISNVQAALGSSILFDARRSGCSDLFIGQSDIRSGSTIEKEINDQTNCVR